MTIALVVTLLIAVVLLIVVTLVVASLTPVRITIPPNIEYTNDVNAL